MSADHPGRDEAAEAEARATSDHTEGSAESADQGEAGDPGGSPGSDGPSTAASSHTLSERGAWIGGALATGVALASALAVGRVTASEGHHLLEAALPTTRFLCSAIMTASATIMALLLTLLSICFNSEGKLQPKHYRGIKRIAFYDAIGFIAASLFLLVHSIPISDPSQVQVPHGWYDVIYYSALALSAALAGFLISIVLQLYGTLSDLIDAYGFKKTEHPSLHRQDREG